MERHSEKPRATLNPSIQMAAKQGGFSNAFDILDIIKPILVDAFKIQLEEFKSQVMEQVKTLAG